MAAAARSAVWNAEDRGSRQRLERGGRFGLNDRVQVGHISRNVQRDDLPDAVIGLTEAADVAADHQARMIDSLAEPNEIAIGPHMFGVTGKPE